MDVNHCGAGTIGLPSAADGNTDYHAERTTDEHGHTFADLNQGAHGFAYATPYTHTHLHADTCAAARACCAA